MSVFVDVFDRLGQAFLQGLLQPFYYIGILLVAFHSYKQIQLERKLFSTRLHSMLDTTGRTVLGGLAAGFLGSVAMAFVGATLTLEALWWIWGLTVLLALLRIRFFCMAYAAGVLGMLHEVAALFPSIGEGTWLEGAAASLRDVQMPALIALVGILHLMEAAFVKWQGSRLAMPLFVENKRGRMVGSYRLQQFWPVPLFLLVPMAGGSAAELPWTPLFGGEAWAGGWGFAAFPVMLGYAETTLSRLPREKAAESAKRLLIYAVVVIGLAALAEWVPAMVALASFLVIGLHELLVWLGERAEAQEPPRYVHGARGLTILAVLPRGPAAEMGLEAGEVILKVNGIAVNSRLELHRALSVNPAYSKLEVLNLEGQSKFVGRAIFADDHYQIGIVLCPDEQVRYIASTKERSLVQLWKRSWKGTRAHKGETV
ncbi:PDZ domain-containing protein [Paenibacillus sp. HJGM_3]|uniref:PDZ domain-containing protein n=1 Tax=Paenibacillus sp. HJGM_3 TaxID=3379816 RepID=UPI00385DDFE5